MFIVGPFIDYLDVYFVDPVGPCVDFALKAPAWVEAPQTVEVGNLV